MYDQNALSFQNYQNLGHEKRVQLATCRSCHLRVTDILELTQIQHKLIGGFSFENTRQP